MVGELKKHYVDQSNHLEHSLLDMDHKLKQTGIISGPGRAVYAPSAVYAPPDITEYLRQELALFGGFKAIVQERLITIRNKLQKIGDFHLKGRDENRVRDESDSSESEEDDEDIIGVEGADDVEGADMEVDATDDEGDVDEGEDSDDD